MQNQNDEISFENEPMDEHEALCSLYAQALFYEWLPPEKRETVKQELKARARQVTYDKTFLVKLYRMTHDLVDDWRQVAQTSKPWDKQGLDGRLTSVRNVLDLNNKRKTPYSFQERKPFRVLYAPPFWTEKNVATAKSNKFFHTLLLSHKYFQYSETQALAVMIHERSHLLVQDHHQTQANQFQKTSRWGIAGVGNAIESIKKINKIMGRKIDLTEQDVNLTIIECAKYALQKIPESDFTSIAFAHGQATDLVQQYDAEFKMYHLSPEEAVVRAAEAYAALLFQQNVEDTCLTMISSIKGASEDAGYSQHETFRQFVKYTEEENPQKSFKHLLGVLPK